jgi:hypothetical protein
MSETLKFKLEVDGAGLKDFEQKSSTSFLRVAKNIEAMTGKSVAELRKLSTELKKVNDQLASMGKSGGGSGGGGIFGGGSGGFLGFLANTAVFSLVHRGIGLVITGIKDLATGLVDAGVGAVKMAGDFEKTINALSVATGSARLARQEISAVDAVARNTTGLRLESAEQGYTRLRNLGSRPRRPAICLRDWQLKRSYPVPTSPRSTGSSST